MKKQPQLIIIAISLLIISTPLLAQQMDTIIVPKQEIKSHIIGVSYIEQGTKIYGIGGDNFGLSLMYGHQFKSPKDSTRNILSSDVYFTAKAGYLTQQFDNDIKNEDWTATLGFLMQQPLYKMEIASLQFGIDMGILNRNSEKTVYYWCFSSGFLLNIYKGLNIGVDLKVQANKLDKAYTGGGLSLNYKF